MKIVILDGATIIQNDLRWDELSYIGELEVHERTDEAKVVSTIGKAEAVFTSKCHMNAEVMDACSNLKFIGALATGYDNIDIKAAKERGIAVCNVPAYSTDSVAQHTFALILEITNQVGLNDEAVQSGEWSRADDFCLSKNSIIQLAGKSLGIIGYGNIGRKVAAIAEAFGMKVNIYSRDREAVIKSDILTVHCPATEENKGFINKEFIRQMKDGAILINTARGTLVNEKDLAEALCSGKLTAAAVDVLDGEPPRQDNPLIGVPNLFITPHVAWASVEARSTICRVSAENLKSFIEGDRLNRVD